MKLKLGDKFKDKSSTEEDELWIVKSCVDIHNIYAITERGDGDWLLCVHPTCNDSIIEDIELIND